MKSKILPFTLLVLVLLNGGLIFMLITKSNQKKRPGPQRGFLIEQLQFSAAQEEAFHNLDIVHKEKMMQLDHQIMKQKDILFKAIDHKNVNIDSLVEITGHLEAKKDLEVFTFFKSVKNICTKEQQEKFTEIISKALRGPKFGRFPEKDRNHPPREGGMFPPPHLQKDKKNKKE